MFLSLRVKERDPVIMNCNEKVNASVPVSFTQKVCSISSSAIILNTGFPSGV